MKAVIVEVDKEQRARAWGAELGRTASGTGDPR